MFKAFHALNDMCLIVIYMLDSYIAIKYSNYILVFYSQLDHVFWNVSSNVNKVGYLTCFPSSSVALVMNSYVSITLFFTVDYNTKHNILYLVALQCKC